MQIKAKCDYPVGSDSQPFRDRLSDTIQTKLTLRNATAQGPITYTEKVVDGFVTLEATVEIIIGSP